MEEQDNIMETNLEIIVDYTEVYTVYLDEQSTPMASDLEILINNEILKVHKIILTDRNEVFKVMLHSPMVESKQNRIEITDCDPSAFKVFLTYLYSSQVSAEDINLELLMIAEKYFDLPLKNRCLEKLCCEISMQNIIETAQVATQCNFEELITACQNFAIKNYTLLLGTPQLEAILEAKILAARIFKGLLYFKKVNLFELF